MSGDEIRDELLRIELALARRVDPGVPGGLHSLIADDFVEFGASGRTWDAAEVRALIAGAAPREELEIEGFEVARLAADVVLVTYRVEGPTASLRSSVWVLRAGRWVLRFHQGTPQAVRD